VRVVATVSADGRLDRAAGGRRRPGRGRHVDHGPPLPLRPPRGPRRPHACRTGWPRPHRLPSLQPHGL